MQRARRHSKELQTSETHTNDPLTYINNKDVEQGIPTSRTQRKQKRYPLITAIIAIQDTSSPAASDIPQVQNSGDLIMRDANQHCLTHRTPNESERTKATRLR